MKPGEMAIIPNYFIKVNAENASQLSQVETM